MLLDHGLADVASGVIAGTSQVGGDLGKATKGAVIGALHGTKEVGGEAVDAVGSTVQNLVKTTTEVGGDVGEAARQAMEGVIEGARSVGVKGADTVSAAAAGAILTRCARRRPCATTVGFERPASGRE